MIRYMARRLLPVVSEWSSCRLSQGNGTSGRSALLSKHLELRTSPGSSASGTVVPFVTFPKRFLHTFLTDDQEQPLLVKTVPFTSKPRSLSLDVSSGLRIDTPPPQGFSGFLLQLLGYYSEHAKLVRGSRNLHERIDRQVNRWELYEALNLPMNFRTTVSMRVLHLWLCMVRLQAEGKGGKKMKQMLYDQHTRDLEKRVIAAGVKFVASKWMKFLEKCFYGACAAYDRAMLPSSAQDELARALWRNVFAEDASEMPTGPEAASVQLLARYVRRETSSLALTESESLLSGNILFSSDFGIVLKRNKQTLSRRTVDDDAVAAANAR